MRRTTLLTSLLLLGSLTAIAAPADAIGCPGPTLILPGPDGDVAFHDRYPACGYDVVVNEGKECPAGDEDWNRIQLPYVGSVSANTCGDPDRGLLDEAGFRFPLPMDGRCERVPANAVATVDDDCRDVEQQVACDGERTREFVHTPPHSFVVYHCLGL